jgi:hypothetical protein
LELVGGIDQEEFKETDVDPLLWDQVKAGYADAYAVKETAYIISRSDAPAGVLRFDLNTPTTYDRVSVVCCLCCVCCVLLCVLRVLCELCVLFECCVCCVLYVSCVLCVLCELCGVRAVCAVCAVRAVCAV